MRHISLRSACLVVAGSVAALSLAAQSMGREWSLGERLKLEAEVETFDGKEVRLKPKDGFAFSVPIERLGEADRAYLKKTYPDGKQPAKESEASPAKSNPAKAAAGKPAAAKAPSAKPAAASAPDAEASDVSVELISLTVIKPIGASVGLVPGTHATLLVSSPSKTLLRVDAEKTKIVCADDRATNLSKPSPDSEASTEKGGLTLDVAPDGKNGTIVFDFPRTPTTKSTRIRLKGELHLVCGSDADPEPVTVPLSLVVSLGL